jgi:hypothetical protein
MQRLLALLLLLLAAPLLAKGQTPATDLPVADRAAIRVTIERQIEAFRRDDGALAFSFASPGIQQIFRDPETFMAMVRGGYMPVYRPREFVFRDVVRIESALVQIVAVTGPDGRRVLALYPMEQQPDGSWRIAGCHLVEPNDEQT